MQQVAYTIRLNGREIDTVFYSPNVSTGDVRRSLIEHDGYDPAIEVNREEYDADSGAQVMNTLERKVVEGLRDKGYAVIIWTPMELGTADPERVQDRSIELGHDVIECLQD